MVLAAFDRVWSRLFTTPIHLDSALAKEPHELRAMLAELVPPLLRAPLAMAGALGVQVPQGEPWTLSEDALATWAPARAIAERAGSRDHRVLQSSVNDFPSAMIDDWTRAFGAKRAAELAHTLGAAPPISLRA